MAAGILPILVIATLSYSAFFLAKAVRNPLRHIPGPTYTLFTTLPLKAAVLQGKRVHHVHKLHLRYGTIVRISPDELSIADPSAFKIIHKVGLSGYTKSPWYFGQTSNGIRAVFNMEDNAQHAARRKLLMPGFTKSNLTRDWETMIKENSQRVVQRMREDVDKTGEVDVYKWWLFYAADTSGEVMFGESFNMIEHGQRNQYIRDVEANMILSGVGYELPLVPLIGRLLPIQSVKQFFSHSELLAGYGQKAIDASKDANSSRHNVFATMNAEAEKGTGLTDTDIAVEAGNLQVAGTDTTGATLTYLTWDLYRSRSVLEKLAAEVGRLDEAQLNDARLAELPYLNAVINETLRLHNAAPSSLPRVVPTGGATLCGCPIPAGTIVGTQAYTIHRLTDRWGIDANEFRPERWLSKAASVDVPPKAKDAFVPWGGGSRACLGQHLAMMQLRLATATFVREFTLTLGLSEKTTLETMEIENYFIIAPKSHHCVLAVRKGDSNL